MKRTTLILLIAVYLISCVGIGVNRFYCCGKLASVTFTYAMQDNSPKEPGTKDNCCKHEKLSFKVKDSHFTVVAAALDHPAPALIPSLVMPYPSPALTYLQTKIMYNGNAPPGHSDTPAYTLNCTYRI
ncbi:HYC_CC_PP family protein [Mucilaginibacter sp. UYCu711]|uniref:HYC_CC_PP family protein n=1 Tax=Mucilaginibacter sp. UYCu711 TaxID=3156339 RepID=UPI003D25F9C9